MVPIATGGPAPGAAGPGFVPGAAAPDDPAKRRKRTILLAAVAAILAIGIGVGAALVVSGGGNDKEQATEADGTDGATAPDDVRSSTSLDPSTVETVATTAPPAVVTTTAPVETRRTTTFWAGVAVMRDRPNVSGNEVRRFTSAEGRSITVIGEIQNGWYQAEADGASGYVYAGLIRPVDGAYCVGEMGDWWPYSRQSTRIVFSSTSNDGEYHLAWLPDGRQVTVRPSEMDSQLC
jgi:hypothetical protein